MPETYLQEQNEQKPKISITGFVDTTGQLPQRFKEILSQLQAQGVPPFYSPAEQYEHQAYLQQKWPGGLPQYVRSQQQRYREAVQKGDTDLIRRLQLDAARVGYSLTEPYREVPVPQKVFSVEPWTDWYSVLSGLLTAQSAYEKANPVYMPFAPGTPTLEAIREANRAAEAAQQLALQAQGLGLEGQRIGLEAAKMAQDRVDTTRKARARAQLIDEYGKLIDQKWAEKGDNVTQEEAEDLLRRIEASILARANEALENGLTLTDLQQIIDILRMRANLQPKWRRVPLLENLTETVGQ